VSALDPVADYQIVDSLGGWEGEAMYVAVPPARLSGCGDRVLLKVISGLGNERVMKRATDELRIFAAVDSPYVVRLHDAGQDGDRLFYSMSYPALGTLARPARALSLDERLAAAADACLGAHALHEVGVVHRSITPGRVMLDEGGARLADLSLARYVATGLVTTTMPDVKEIEYVDPALLRGAPVSRHRHMVARRGPALRRHVRSEPLPRPTRRRPGFGSSCTECAADRGGRPGAGTGGLH
jgi:serine/threonine protein kinase